MSTIRVRVTPEVLDELFTRDHLGNRLSVDWGLPDADGFLVPTITVDYTDNLLTSERTRIAEAAEWLTLADAADDTKPTIYWDGWLAGIAAVLAIVVEP
jgi:hypothetical protein